METETFVANAAWHYETGDLKLIVGQRHIESGSFHDLDGSPYPLHTSLGFTDLDSWSAELQYSGVALEERLQYTLGTTYAKESGMDESLTWAFPDALNPTVNHFSGEIDNSALGFYGQASYAITDKLNATAGLRYTDEWKGITIKNRTEARADLDTVLSNVTILACSHEDGVVANDCAVKVPDANFSDTNYTLGLDYRINDEIMVYAKVSDGFRSGGHQLRSVSKASSTPFGPETVTEYEIGMKGDFLDNRLRVNAALFSNTVEGKQLSTIFVVPGTTTSFTLLQNAAEVENKGFELDITVLPLEGLELRLGYSYVDPSYTDFKTLDPAQLPAEVYLDRSYERQVFVIEEEFSIQATYTTQIDLGELALNVNYRWNEDYANNAVTPEPGLPVSADLASVIEGTTAGVGDGFLGASATLSMGNGLTLSLWGKNLLEVEDFPHSLYIGAPFDYNSRTVYEPRTFGLTANYSFGN